MGEDLELLARLKAFTGRGTVPQVICTCTHTGEGRMQKAAVAVCEISREADAHPSLELSRRRGGWLWNRATYSTGVRTGSSACKRKKMSSASANAAEQETCFSRRAAALSVTQPALSVTHRALSVTQRARSVSHRARSTTQRALSVTHRARSTTQRALSVTQRALSVTQEAHRTAPRFVGATPPPPSPPAARARATVAACSAAPPERRSRPPVQMSMRKQRNLSTNHCV